MRTMLLLSLTTAALLGACASSRSTTAGTDACTQRCATSGLSGLERSTCELDCSRLASNPPAPAPTPPTPPTSPPPQPAPQPLPPQQPAPQPVPPQQPAPQPVPPRPPAPQPAPVGPATTNYSLPPGGGAPVPTGSPQPAATDRQAMANCEAACIRENPSATDQATCKLNCNAVGTTYAAPPSYYVGGGAPPSDADARAAVIRSSGGVVGGTSSNPPRPPAGQPTPPPSPDKAARCASEAQQCNTTCGAQQDPCTQSCEQGKMSSTDRATCKLTCESNVDVCRDDCRIKEGSCRSKP